MKKYIFLFLSFLNFLITGTLYSFNGINVSVINQRHNFYRNENITLTAKIVNTSSSKIDNINITISIHPTNPDITKLADYSGYKYSQ